MNEDSDIPEIVKCSKVLRMENIGEKEFTYSIRGSCFLVKYNNHLLAITAKHTHPDYKIENVKIALDNSEIIVPLLRGHKIKESEDESEFHDILIYEIDINSLTEDEVIALNALDLNKLMKKNITLAPGLRLVVSGFPTELNEPDYENKILPNYRFIITSTYTQTSATISYLHQLSLLDISNISNFDGFSGAPVFSVKSDNYRLAGMILRGTIESGVAHFIGVSVIYELLHKIFGDLD